jgi:SAM-dependent methyltransferase
MRKYWVQALINWAKLFSQKGYWDNKWLLNYGWEWLTPVFCDYANLTNKIFDRQDIRHLKNNVKKLGKFHSGWFQRIFEPETYGIRAWEYGILLSILSDKCVENLKILDIGTGPSLLPEYLANLKAEVISLDIKEISKPWSKLVNYPFKFIKADMCQMPFKDNQFDLVISISAIEHLDDWTKTKTALKEMFRVTKNNGKIYLTTDFYLPRQKTDNWNQSDGKPKEAYSWDKLSKFVEILKVDGFNVNESKKLILSSPRFSNYRGRYFTTVNLWA